MNLAFLWSSTADDERILAATSRIVKRANSLAKSMHLDYPYIYQNYASLDQDVFASYGHGNKQRLIEISGKYDPDQIFRRLQPGYFKLEGGNGGSPY